MQESSVFWRHCRIKCIPNNSRNNYIPDNSYKSHGFTKTKDYYDQYYNNKSYYEEDNPCYRRIDCNSGFNGWC